jgi:MFS family permease
MTFIILEGLAFYGLTQVDTIGYAAPLFILIMISSSLIGLTIDVFLERYTSAKNTGSVRGLFLTVVNSAWILAPLFGGYILDGDDYKSLYIAGLLFLIPLAYLITRNLEHFHDPAYKHASLHSTLRKVMHNHNLRRLFGVNIIINVFYAWMVIYTPIYLHDTIGFSWESIGFILTIMLIPFVLVEIPAGRLADSKLGEKELMAVGFAITGLATIILAYITGASFWLWALALFMTRVGAALTEVMIETYFFKKVPQEDANMLGAFRITRPISTIIAPLFVTIGLMFTDHRGLFVIFGVLCISAIAVTVRIKDTN